MNDNKKDITKIGDLASWDHEDDTVLDMEEVSKNKQTENIKEDLDFESTEFNSFENQTSLDDKTNIEEDLFSDLDMNQAFQEEETKNDKSITLLSELHQYDSEADNINIEKELTTIKEINSEINLNKKIAHIHEPITSHIHRNIPIEASPSFSLILKNIEKEHKNNIKDILETFNLADLFSDQILERAFNKKELLIPRVSEFVGVALIHKLKNLNLKYELCLSSSMDNTEFDPMDNGASFDQEKTFKNVQKNILTSESNTLPNHEIQEIGELVNLESHLNPQTDHGVEEEYKFLTESLKLKAIKNDADAIIGLNFQHFEIKSTGMIKVVISGTLAWIK